MDNNQLSELPVELCAISRLEELHIANNQLIGLPLEFGFLINLEKLHLQKNRIRELPEVSVVKTSELVHDNNNKMACGPIEDSDQPMHTPSPVRVFAVCLKKVLVRSHP